MFDCTIIGCGPSGSNLGRILSENGLKVAILDRRLEIGSPLRTDGLVNVHDLQRSGLETEGMVKSRIKSVQLTCGSSHAELKASGGPGDAFNASVETDKLHKEMAALSALAGSGIFLRTDVTGIRVAHDGSFHVAATQNGREKHFQSRLVVMAAGGLDFLHLEGVNSNPVRTRSIVENYCRDVTGSTGEIADLSITSRPHLSIGLDFPFSAGIMDRLELEMAREPRHSDMGTPHLIMDRRVITVPAVPEPVQFGLPVIGVQSGYWNPLFLSGFAHAVKTSTLLAGIILDNINEGSAQVTDIYARAMGGEVLETISGEISLVAAMERSNDRKISHLVQEISGSDLREISLIEIIKKSGIKLDEMINMLLGTP